MAQLVEIDNFWNGVAFYCPACGAEVYAPEGQGTCTPCEHLLFSWIDAVGDFENARPEIQEILEQVSTEDEPEPCPFDEVLLDALPDNTVVFALTHHGMACGPTSLTVFHAIQFPINDIG